MAVRLNGNSPPPLVTVVIPTLRGGEMLDACLAALDRQTMRDFEAIVVNNGGAPVNAQCRAALRVLNSQSNIGFGGAINRGIEASAAPMIATLNDDAEPDPEWLAELVREMQFDAACGMCASNIRLFGKGLLDSAGMLICLDGSSKQRGGALPADSFAAAEEVLLPSACAALYRREMLDRVGLFDAEFFLYCEDTDLGLRARWDGWTCRYSALATVSHRYSASVESVAAKARLVERNRMWVALRNFPLPLLAVAPFVSLLRYFWHWNFARRNTGMTSAYLASGGSGFAGMAIVARALGETALRLPALLRQRRAILRARRIGTPEFTRILFRHRITAREIARA